MEARYLQHKKKTSAVMRVQLRDGQSVEGVIREFDREVLTVEADSGPVLIRKSEIRYIEEPQ